MSSKEIYDNYIITRDGKPVDSGYYKVHDRNMEGFEMQFMRFMPEDKGASILDVGCGCGQLLAMLKKRGYARIQGVDIGPTQVEITRKLDINAEHIHDLVEYLNGHKETWDTIILSQVIEHFPKDKMLSNLSALRSALKDKGKLVIATPNMALMTGLVQRYTDFTHEMGFTERSLNQVLRVAGFSGIKIHGEKFSFRPRIKYLIWILLQGIWFKILAFIYLLEKATDRPRIISRHLIAVAVK